MTRKEEAKPTPPHPDKAKWVSASGAIGGPGLEPALEPGTLTPTVTRYLCCRCGGKLLWPNPDEPLLVCPDCGTEYKNLDLGRIAASTSDLQITPQGPDGDLGTDQRQAIKELRRYGLCLSLSDLWDNDKDGLFVDLKQKLSEKGVSEVVISMVVTTLERETNAMRAQMRTNLARLIGQMLGRLFP